MPPDASGLRGRHVKFVTPRERIVHLKTVPMLRRLPSRALIGLAQRMHERELPARARLIAPDAPVQSGFILVDGRVSLHWGDRKVMTVDAPNNVGFLGILARLASGVEAIAETPLIVLEISGDDLLAAYEASGELTMRTMRTLAHEILDLRNGYPADPKNPPVAEVGPDVVGAPDFVDRLMSWHTAKLFANANLDAIADLVRLERTVRFEAGEVVWNEGDPSSFSLDLLRGVARCELSGGRDVMRIGHGYTLGLDVMAESPRRFTLVAESDVVGQRLDHEDWLNVLEDQTELALAYLTAMAQFTVTTRAQTLDQPPELGFVENDRVRPGQQGPSTK